MAYGAGHPEQIGAAFSSGMLGQQEAERFRQQQARDDELRTMQIEEYQTGKEEKAAAKAEAARQKAARDAAIDQMNLPPELKAALKTEVASYGDVVPKETYRAPINIGGKLYDPNDPTKLLADHSQDEISTRLASRPQTILNMPGNPSPDEMGRGEFAKQNAAAQAKYFDNVATAGAQAQTRMGDIDQLTKLIEMTPQGAGQEYLNKGAAVLSRFGIDLGEYANVPAAQAFQSIVSRVAPTLRVAGSGATSDFEMQQFLASLPAIGNMPGGNRIIARNMKKISERSVNEAYIAAQVQGGDLTPAQGRKKSWTLARSISTCRHSAGLRPAGQVARHRLAAIPTIR